MNKEWIFLSLETRVPVGLLFDPSISHSSVREMETQAQEKDQSIAHVNWPFQIKVGQMREEKLIKTMDSLRNKVRSVPLQKHIFHRLNIEGFTKHNKQLAKARVRTGESHLYNEGATCYGAVEQLP